jgi:hypothetical protein
MTSAYPPVVNVAHVADGQGKCARCGAGLGVFVQVADADNGLPEVHRPWKVGERVVEYEAPNARTYFADAVVGFTIDCRE